MVMNNKAGSTVLEGTEGRTMKKWWLVTPLVVALLVLMSVPSYAWRGGHHFHGGPRVFVGLGVGPWWGYPYPYWYYPPPYYYSPTVVVQQPPVYVEQQTVAPAPPAASAPPAQQQYWYYCQPAGGYYPNVQTCTEPWVKVPARSQ
jgi:hypothetical protein